MAIDFSTTYDMAEAFKRGAFRPNVVGYRDIEDKALREYQRGELKPLLPLKLGWAEGWRMMDYTGTTAVLPDVISQGFAEALRECGAVGWDTFPIELRGKDGELIDGYQGLVVLGRCGPRQDARSRLESRIGPSGKASKFKVGFYFDESTWDGSDVFTPADTTFVFVTEKVKRALEIAKITNVNFTSLDSVAEIC